MTNTDTTDTSNNLRGRQIQQLADYIESTALAPLPLPPEFFYASLPLCVIDAVFSIGVKYASTWNTVVGFSERQNWHVSLEADAKRLHGEHSIADLLTLLEGLSPEQMADDLFGNQQRTSSRSGILKAEAVLQFASALGNARIDDFCDLNEDRLAIAEALIREIPGQASGISFDYFRMLAGDDNLIKPDRMVQRYIAKALGVTSQQVAPELARTLMQDTVQTLNARGKSWTPRKLDYAIWNAQSAAAKWKSVQNE